MADIKKTSECFVKPKYDVEAANQPYHLSPIELSMLNIHPIQKGLLFSHNKLPSTDDHTKLVSHLLEKLKQSLSIALVHFYPLAGRFSTEKYPNEHACTIFIDCLKGPGARLIHATALEISISDIISSKVVPTIVHSMFELGEKSINYDGHTRALLSIQVTELKDGVFIGFTMNHCVVDGTSFIHFISMLSEIFRTRNNNTSESTTIEISRVPIYNYKPWVNRSVDNKDYTILKLPHLEPEEFIERRYHDSGSLRERIFHFSPTMMARLKAKANKECGTQNVVSSFQALSALVWRSITRARNLSSNQITSCFMLINARSRFDPPLTDDYFGNFISATKRDCNVDELLSNDLGWVALKLRETIITHDEKEILGLYKLFAESPMRLSSGAEVDFFGINNVTIGGSARFDMYEPEFGLERALAVRMGFANKEDGKVTTNPGREGGGSVGLEISLEPNIMDALQDDLEFMSFVSLQ